MQAVMTCEKVDAAPKWFLVDEGNCRVWLLEVSTSATVGSKTTFSPSHGFPILRHYWDKENPGRIPTSGRFLFAAETWKGAYFQLTAILSDIVHLSNYEGGDEDEFFLRTFLKETVGMKLIIQPPPQLGEPPLCLKMPSDDTTVKFYDVPYSCQPDEESPGTFVRLKLLFD